MKYLRKLRWLLFVPLGVYEFTLIWLVILLIPINKKLAARIFNHADKLPGLEWYKE